MQRCDPGTVGDRVAQRRRATNAREIGGARPGRRDGGVSRASEGDEDRQALPGMHPDALPDALPGRQGSRGGGRGDPRRWPVRAPRPLAALLARRRAARAGWHEEEGAGTRFAAACRDSLAQGRGLAFAALAFSLGIAAYFRLPSEPQVLVVAAATLLAWAGWRLAGRRGAGALPLLGLALVLSGLLAGTARTALVAAPVIDRARSLTVSGFVEEVERTGRGVRLVLHVMRAERLAAEATPRRVRISLRGAAPPDLPGVGEAVRLRARLTPPAPAVMPGGYDFAFRAFFDGIGATGFAFGAPSRIDLGPAPLSLRAKAEVAGLRQAIAARILAALGETPAAALAVALITGDRSLIPEPVTEALRTAGLAHILAISGLHMALFAGSVFFVARAALALSPRLVHGARIEAVAALAALSAAAFYLTISGGSIATQRAFLMIALVLAGRIFGRRALTLRNVAIAVFVILAAMPEALLDPGFQMSFAAVIALVAAYEEMTRRRLAREQHGLPRRGLLPRATAGAAGWVLGLLLTSLIAGVATGAIGAYHFHRIAPLGPLGNLLAMPVVTLVVMPFAALSLLLLPFGLELLPLLAMGAGVDQVVAMAQWVQDLTPEDGVIGAPSLAGTLAVVAAGLTACLAPRGYRRAALVPLAASVLLYAGHRQPDMLISANGGTLALRDAAGVLRVSGRTSGFLPEVWLRAEGVGVRHHRERRIAAADMRCDDMACLLRAHGPPGQAPVAVPGAPAQGPPGNDASAQDPPRKDPPGKDPSEKGATAQGPSGKGPSAQGLPKRDRPGQAPPLQGATATGQPSQGRQSQGQPAHGPPVHGQAEPPPAARMPAAEPAPANGLPGPGAGLAPVAAGQNPPALLVSLVRDAEAFEEDCRKADIIVSALTAPPDCQARQVFDGARLAREGAVALTFGVPDTPVAPRSTPARVASAVSPPSNAGGALAVAVRPSYGSRRPWTPK